MIGSFWNLCRACPSMPVDKLHSEYRSTYRWHEYRGGNKPANGVLPGDPSTQTAAATTQPAPGTDNIGGAPVVRRAPLPSQNNANGPRAAPSIEPAMPRRKKYPGVAYKSNELFDGPAAGLPSGAIREGSYTLDRARSMERSKYLANKGERRSKSEGPRNALPNGPRNWTDTVEEKATSPSIAEKMCVSSEYRNQFAWPRDGPEATIAESAGQPKKSASMGALKAAQQAAKRRPGEGGPSELDPLMNHTDDDDDKKRYIEDYMKDADQPAPAPRYVMIRSTLRNAFASFRRSAVEQKEPTKPKGYKSEYKKKFRPFSHYVYEASKGTFTKRRAVKKEDVVDASAGGTRGAGPPPENKAPAPTPQQDECKTLVNLQGLDDSWYREVLDLRKRAGEYKCRGWGTELAPDHLNELYNKQMDVWYQVSRRSSLSALSLASASHRVLGKDEKESESRRTSPSKKPKSFKMAPHQSMHAMIGDKSETAAQKAQRKKLHGHSFDNTSMSEGKTGRSSARTSPRKQLNLVIGARGSSVEPSAGDHKPLYRSPKRRPRSADPKPLSNGPLEERRRPSKPSGLALKKYTPSEDGADKKNVYKQTPSLSGSPKRKAKTRVGITIDDDVIPLRTGSAFRDHRGALLDDSPVVKSPPEPTRVKSPEQMNMRSPDPVNWTVPLDTGKTFTVSQTVKNDDLNKRPGSDFRGQWGGDDPHSASLSAPLDHTEGSIKKHAPQPTQHHVASTSQQEFPSVHSSPSTSKQDNTKLTPPKTVEISQQPPKTSGKLYAKTPTSPPSSLTPIDETKVLELAMKVPTMNGGTESNSETYSSPTTEHRKSIVSPTTDQNKSMTSPVNEHRKSLTSPTSEKRKSLTSPTVDHKKSPLTSPTVEIKNVTTEQPKYSGSIRIDDPSFEMSPLLKSPTDLNPISNAKPTEATQKSHGGVDTAVVLPQNQASIAADVLERARTRFDQFWGKKEENDSV